MARKRKGRRRRSGGGSGLFNQKNLTVLGTTAALGYLSRAAKAGKANFYKDMPIITPVGRTGTIALAAGLAYQLRIGRKYTGPIAIAAGMIAAYNLVRRGELYRDEGTARGDYLGADDEPVQLEGDIDLEGGEFDDAVLADIGEELDAA